MVLGSMGYVDTRIWQADLKNQNLVPCVFKLLT